ncbi:MAG: fibronectin type III domain-containing protein [Eubacteriales bacterium]|nr:fibronectin type III domain-containing protein [Eubacteriales bacterium]
MKKLISVTVAICVAITSLFTGIYAMADNKVTSADVKEKIEQAAAYVTSNETDPYTLSNARNFVTIIDSGVDVSKYKDAFAASVKENLDANKAKLCYNNVVSPAYYGATFKAFDALNVDKTSFNGYNLVSSFEAIDISLTSDNVYTYGYAIDAAKALGNETLALTLCDKLVSNYTMGSGLDNWGFSCDNNGFFVLQLAPYYNEYKEYVDDALSLIGNNKTENGYYFNAQYGTDANADSTAAALAAYSAVSDMDKAKEAYDFLCAFESEDTPGKYGEYISTTYDALIGFENYYKALKAEEDSTTTTETTTKSTLESTTVSTTATTVATTSTTAPVLMTTTTKKETTTKKAATKAKYSRSGAYIDSTQKKPTVKKLTKGKKSVKITWKKVTGIAGYQINISTSKKFNKELSSYTVNKKSAKTKTIKGLKAKKTYYVRIRTYKKAKINGKTVKVYSKWSATKSVKTK